MPLRKIDRLFNYTYSTAPTPSLDSKRVPLVRTNTNFSTNSSTRCILFMQIYASSGWFWTWLTDIKTVRSLLPRRPEVVLNGRCGDGCCHLYEGIYLNFALFLCLFDH